MLTSSVVRNRESTNLACDVYVHVAAEFKKSVYRMTRNGHADRHSKTNVFLFGLYGDFLHLHPADVAISVPGGPVHVAFELAIGVVLRGIRNRQALRLSPGGLLRVLAHSLVAQTVHTVPEPLDRFNGGKMGWVFGGVPANSA